VKIVAALGEARDGWPWDRAMRFGMSVFETIAIHNRQPLFLDEHLERLNRAANELMEVSAASLCAEARKVVLHGGLAGSGVARVYVGAGEGGPADPVESPSGFVLAEECDVMAGPGGGLRVMVHAAPYVAAPGGWKTGNYWQNVRALRDALRSGCAEAILTGPGGAVVSFAMGNLFAVINGNMVTPPTTCGARPGVVRQWVMQNLPCAEVPLATDDLRGAESLFMTNSRCGIVWISEMDGRPLSMGPASDLASRYARDVLNA
jgi:branched-chain amino acid aminotransferase